MKIVNNTNDWDAKYENLFGDCEETLDLIKENRIFRITYFEEDNVFYMEEKCDGHFGVELTSKMANDLAIVFSEIAKKIK